MCSRYRAATDRTEETAEAAERHNMPAISARLGGHLSTCVVCSLAEQRHDAFPGRLGCADHVCLCGAWLLRRAAPTHEAELKCLGCRHGPRVRLHSRRSIWSAAGEPTLRPSRACRYALKWDDRTRDSVSVYALRTCVASRTLPRHCDVHHTLQRVFSAQSVHAHSAHHASCSQPL